MAVKPKNASKSLEELLEESKVKKEALKKIIDKVKTNNNHKTQ